MSKLLSRWGRVIGRLWLTYATLHRNAKIVIATITTLLGVSAVAFFDELRIWVKQDWAHPVLIVAASLCVFALFALNAAEKELEAKSFVQIRIAKIAAEFRPILGEGRNILIASVDVSFRNETEKPTRAFFPKIEVLWQGGKEWYGLVVRDIEAIDFLGGEIAPRGCGWEGWEPNQRHEIPPLEDMLARFKIQGEIPAHDLRLLEGNLKVRLTIDMIGQSKFVLEHALPKVDMKAFA